MKSRKRPIIKTMVKQTSRVVANILDSDDELPDSYEETPEIPAYLNDFRFDDIQLPWLENCKPVKLTEQKVTQEKLALEIDEPKVGSEIHESKILISKGIMTREDLFFVKSIEEYCSESTLIWFIESLKNKSVDRFHKSCLASDICYSDFKVNGFNPFDYLNANYYCTILVSK